MKCYEVLKDKSGFNNIDLRLQPLFNFVAENVFTSVHTKPEPLIFSFKSVFVNCSLKKLTGLAFTKSLFGGDKLQRE